MPYAMRVYEHGGPEKLRWEQVQVGEPGEGQVRVRNTAVGLNFVDTYHRSGLYPMPLPFTLGMEGAGVVEAVGPKVKEFKVGDRVAYAQPDWRLRRSRAAPGRAAGEDSRRHRRQDRLPR